MSTPLSCRVFSCFLSVLASWILFAGSANRAGADPILWVNDSGGNLGTVDAATGSSILIGNTGTVLTDIAFDPNGNLFGISFSDLYQINTITAALTLVGPHGVPGGNALVFGSDGTLYAAGSATNLYQINPANGATTNLGGIGASSAGDLAFAQGNLYLSSTSNDLIRITLPAVSGTVVGPFGFNNVFGLASPDNNALYGLSGTQVFSVNLLTGAGTLLSNYGGGSLLVANGSSFITEAVPEPCQMLLALVGLISLATLTNRQNCRFCFQR